MIDRETEGNPFFVEEVSLHLVESGVLLDEHGRVRTDLRLDEVSVPESIRLVLGQRLDRLTASTRNVLVAAAVSGRTFESDVVGAVAGGCISTQPTQSPSATLTILRRTLLILPTTYPMPEASATEQAWCAI